MRNRLVIVGNIASSIQQQSNRRARGTDRGILEESSALQNFSRKSATWVYISANLHPQITIDISYS
jgi:hypothetical protein